MNKFYSLYSRPSFLSGAARLVDLGGTFDRYQTSASPAQADSRALAQDWQSTGKALRKALRQFRAHAPKAR